MRRAVATRDPPIAGWEGRRDEVVALALAAGRQAGDLELPARILRWLVDDPRAADRELLRWSVGQDGNWQLPYWAVQGLERLGEDSGEWRQRLEELSRSENPFIRLHAAAGLVRRGDEARLQEIVGEAVAAEDPCVRGEAIRVLGELNAVQHIDLIQRALWAEEQVFVVRDDPDDEMSAQSFIPVAEEAGLALARLGTPEAITALLQGFLYLPSGDPQFQSGYHLQAIIARLDGRTEPFDTMPGTGWRQERFGRLP